MQHFHLIGLSYKNTPLNIRGKLSFDESASKAFMQLCNETLDIKEMLVLSTCNRFEIYYSGTETNSQIIKLLRVFTKINQLELPLNFQVLQGHAALAHLFRVGIGLESKVIGDIQIINQVKNAYQWSADINMAQSFIHRTLHTLFYTHKRVVQKTSFRDGSASLASVTSDMTKKYIRSIENPRILLVGLGEIGMDVAKNLKGCQAEVIVINRTQATAESIAQSYNFQAVPFHNLSELLEKSDVIISAVRCNQPILTKEDIRTNGRRLMVDLSVPMSISSDISKLPNVELYNVDQLSDKTSATLKNRQSCIPQVESIISEAIDELSTWSQDLEISPIIQQLKNALEEIRKNEMARYVHKLDELQTELLDTATKNIINKVIRIPVLQLKSSCKRNQAEHLSASLRKLFDLEAVHKNAS